MGLSTHELVAGYPRHVRPALDRVSLEVAGGTTLAIVGPSGAGKTTLLRVIAGLLRARSGDVRLGGASIADLPPQERRAALVFQDDALFDNMTVRENLRFALGARGSSPGASVSAPRLPARSCPSRRCCCSTSRWRISIRGCGATSATKSSACASASLARSSTSPTITSTR
jgi:ABC-type sugar transport system ATPase subunit